MRHHREWRSTDEEAGCTSSQLTTRGGRGFRPDRSSRKTLREARAVALLEERQQLFADSVAQIARLDVGGILAPREAMRVRVGRDFGTGHVEQRAQDPIPPARDTVDRVELGAAEQRISTVSA